MGKETSQRVGRDGMYEIKEWLEATTRFAFPYTVWDSEAMVTRTCLDGSKKAFDLEGHTVGAKGEPFRPVSVECKKYSVVGGQADEFREFLAIAYSDTAHTLRDVGVDAEREYMWVTTHPFSQSKWPKLHTLAHLRECVEEHADLRRKQEDLEQHHAIDDDVLATVANRIWVMVVGQKQIDIRLSRDELSVVSLKLRQEGYRA